jgi:hypothetical protein
VRSRESIADYRLAPYGTGAGLLRAAFEETVDLAALEGATVVADSRDPATTVVLSVLEAAAAAVYRGVR